MPLIRLLTVVLMLLGCACNSDKISRLEKENRDLAAKLGAVSKAANLDTQEKCAKQARSEFIAWGWAKDPMANFENHYNAKVNKCFVHITSTASQRKPYVPTTSQVVSDAFEGKTYATYMWMNIEGKKYWEVAPFDCRVTSLTGEETHCKSAEEFDELIKQFMEQ